MEKIRFKNFKGRVSWGSIIGGVITVLAISILLAVLGASIGFFTFDPLSSKPASGIGTATGIMTIISLLISFAAGGFVAGKLAGADGIIHGFLVWSTTLIVTVILVGSLAVGTVRVAGNMLGSVASMAGDVVSGAGSFIENSGIGNQAEDLFGNLDFDDRVNQQEMRQDVRRALRRSGVKEFQPEYLEGQYRAVRRDLDRTVKKVAANPMNAESIINGFTNRLQKRIDNYSQNVNREDFAKAIANNTELTRAEAEETVDQYMYMFEQGKEQLQNLNNSVGEISQQWDQIKQEALVGIDKASNAAGRGALIGFFAILIAAALCACAGYFGAKTTKEGYEV